MARPSRLRSLTVWMNGEQVGRWTIHPGRPDEFTYADEWISSSLARPISLSLPLSTRGYRGDVVAAYFDNLLPDSRSLRERIQRRFGTRSSDTFDLLQEVGRDCVGAIQLLPEDEAPNDVRPIQGSKLTDAQVETLLSNLRDPRFGRDDADREFRISLAGAQEKTALLRHKRQWMRPVGTTPSTHILKPPIGIGADGIALATSVENEWLCSRILDSFGIPVAHCEMRQFGDQKALIVERFDRRLSTRGDWIIRLPQEDFCQATGTPSARKYESDGGPGIGRIMDLLLGSSQAVEDRQSFFKTQMLFWMLCAIDGHAKNFSIFLEPAGTYRLTPRYDVLSAYPIMGKGRGQLSPNKAKMAMAVEGASRHYRWLEISPRHWEETARRCGLAATYPDLVQEIIETSAGVMQDITSALPSDFPESVLAPVLDGLNTKVGQLSG